MQVYSLSKKKLIEMPDEGQVPEQPMMADGASAVQPMQPEPTVQPNISPMEDQPVTNEPMKYITGRSLEEHNQALQQARSAGDKDAVKAIQDDYKREYDYQKDTGAFTKDDTNTKSLEAKKDIYKNAKYMLSVIDQIEKGDLDGDAADTALNFAASRYAASQGFEEGGKALTAPELTVLGGSIPIIKARGKSFLDNITGNIPSQTGKVDEDIDSIKAKMLLSMNYLDGKDVTDLKGQLGEKDKGFGEKVVDFAKSTFIDPITHYAQDAGAGAALNNEDGQRMQESQQSTIENSNRLMAKADEIQATNPQEAQRLRKVAEDALAQVSANSRKTSGEFSEDINTPYALRALETGATIAGGADLIANPMTVVNAVKAPFQIARHPIKTADTVANVVRHPVQAGKEFIKADIAASGYKGTGLPGGGASAGMSIDDAVGTGTPIDGQIVANAGKPIDLANDAAGRLATKVASPDMGSVVKSEKLMKTALQTTDSITRRGMARELETNIGKIGNTVDDYVRDLDTVIGDMPKDDIISSVDQILSERIPASYRPEIDQVLRNVGNDLSNGNYVGEGINEATTLVKINEVRKKLNNEIPSSWFQNGMPTNSRADVMYAIKWDVSNQLKAMLGDADLQGFINKSLGIQHASYQTYPVLSKEALTENERLGNGVFGAVRSAWDKVTTAPTIIAARNAQGQADDLTRQILRGERPKVSGGSAQLQNTDMLVENADTSIPAAKPDPGVSSTTVGQQPIQGRQYTNIRETREVTDAKGKVSLEMKDKAGKWVPYKASPTNFRKVDSASQKSVNGGMSVDDATLKIALEGGEPRTSYPPFEKDGRSLMDYNNDELTIDELQNKLVLANEGNEGRTAVKEIEDAIDSRMGTTTKTDMLPAEGANIKQVTPEEAGDVVYLTKKAFEEGRYQDAREYWEALPDGNKYKEGMRSLMEKSLRPSTISKKKITSPDKPKFKSVIEALNDPEFSARQNALVAQQKNTKVAGKSNNLYHTTPAENLDSIRQNGLQTGKKPRFEGVSSSNKISFSANEEAASYYGGNNDVMIRTKTSYKPTDLEEDLLAGGEGTYTTSKNIPPEFLEVKIKGKWEPLIKPGLSIEDALAKPSRELTVYRTGSLDDSNRGLFTSTKKATAEQYGKETMGHEGELTIAYTVKPDANIKEAGGKLQLLKELDPTAVSRNGKFGREPGRRDNVYERFANEQRRNGGKLIDGKTAEQRLEFWTDKEIARLAKAQGYDGIKYTGGDGSDVAGEVQILNPKVLNQKGSAD